MTSSMGKMLIVFGIILIAIGVVFLFGGKIGIGKLPGDIAFKKGNFSFYFPIATSIILSIFITLILNILRRIF